MSWYTFVLGESFILLFIAAVIAGLWSAHSKAQTLAGNKPFVVNDDARRDAIGKAAILLGIGAVIYFDSDDLNDALLRIAAPVGIYKIVQTLLTPFLAWRSMESQNLIQQPEAPDGR
ncbi:MAG: hypothetical protein KDD90_02575 [Sphingomonadaceae bacterium]|nr:hypothetical protein [Sphingomonadaceae bacterium]